jgi:hypothetical protein
MSWKENSRSGDAAKPNITTLGVRHSRWTFHLNLPITVLLRCWKLFISVHLLLSFFSSEFTEEGSRKHTTTRTCSHSLDITTFHPNLPKFVTVNAPTIELASDIDIFTPKLPN